MLKRASGGSTINQSIRINEQIRASELRVIGADGEQLGIISRAEALKAAADAGLDLVEISPNAAPPVAKIVDWGKYQYAKMKEAQKNRRNNKASELKQMRFGLRSAKETWTSNCERFVSFSPKGTRSVSKFSSVDVKTHTEKWATI